MRKFAEDNIMAAYLQAASEDADDPIAVAMYAVETCYEALESRWPTKQNNKSGKVPVQAIVDMYHEILPKLEKVKKLTSKRESQIKARWHSGDIESLQEWRSYFELVKTSKFLMGLAGGERPFKANLEWLTKEANFVKVWEGNYHE